MRRAWASLLLLTAACGQLIQYSDELVDARTGRTEVVIWPATVGGVVGFAVGIPVDVIALPVTYPVYLLQKSDSGGGDVSSTLLFPSFVLWRAGAIVLGAPFDLLEFGVYRAWQPPAAPNREDQERFEMDLDERTLPVQSVETLHPRKRA